MPSPLNEIRSIVRDVLCDRDLDIVAETRFDDIHAWEPMDLVTLVVELECRFDVVFELPEIDRLATVADLVAMIESKQALAAA